MAVVTAAVAAGRQGELAQRIRARSLAAPEITPRPLRELRRALRAGRLVVAEEGEELLGWFLSEPCGPGLHELGYLFVEPGARGAGVLHELLLTGFALDEVAVAVTFRADFAALLQRKYGFRRSSLGGVIVASRGWFLWRRLAPRRLVTALQRTSAGGAHYLIREPA